MSRWLKRSLIAVAIIIGLLLLSMLIVPWQLKKQGTSWITTHTERTLDIEKVYFNPFTLKLELSGINLTEPNSDQPFVSCSRLMVSASLRSLIDRALILRRIELDKPYVKIDLLGKQTFNFSDFIPADDVAAPAEAQDEVTKPFLFSLNNIVITAGEIDFNDEASPQSSHHQIRQLALSVPVVGNVHYLAEKYVTPELSMVLNGADIQAHGQSKPFHNSLETELSLAFFDADLAFYAQNSPISLPVEVMSGILDCEINFTYQTIGSELPKLIVSGDFIVSDLVINEPSGDTLFTMDTLLLDLDEADIFQQEITLSSLEFHAPQLALTRDPQGQLNLLRLFTSSADAPEPSPAAIEDGAESSIPLVLIKKIALHDGQITFDDHALSEKLSHHVDHLALAVENLSTHADAQTTLHLELHTARMLELAVDGTLSVVPPQAQMKFAASSIELAPYYPYLEHVLTAPIGGQVELSGQVDYTEANTVMHDGALTVHDLQVPFAGDDHFSLSKFQLRDSSIDLSQQLVQLGHITLIDGVVQATRLEDGTLSPLKLLREAESTPQKKSTTQAQETEPWKIDLAILDLTHFKVQLRDQTTAKKPEIMVNNLGLHAENLSYPEARKSPFKLTAKVGKQGDVRIDGTLVHTPLQLTANTRLDAFPLADFNDFIPTGLNLNVEDGQLFSTLSLRLNQQQDELQGSFNGQFAVRRFNLLDTQGGELLSWQALNVAGIQGTVAPFAVQIKEVALDNYQTNIEISSTGQINLTSAAASEAEEPETTSIAKTEEATAPPTDIRIDAVTLQGGTVSFTDRHLPSTFATTMYDLGGRISGLSSDEQMQADVDLRGQLENNSPLTIIGKINPLSNDLFADLTISFKDIDLSPMTPYSGTYLGYAIAKGKLYLDLNYKIEHQQIQADNNVMIDQFTFGESVDSEQATSLPVSLAISLLKDRNDEIHLDIPISGNLNDPDFSLAGTIFTVLRNLLVKAATSPFALLSSLVGGGEDGSSISFDLGHADINDAQQQKLVGLADILTNRPALILEISAFADKINDPEAYRHQQLTEMMQTAKWRELDDDQRKDGTAYQLEITAEEYQQLLKTVYKKAEFPRPRNVIGMLKSLPAEEMEKLLLANIRAGDEELAALAKARAMVVRDGIVAINEELKPRLFLMKTDIYTAPQEGVASRVEFDISTK